MAILLDLNMPNVGGFEVLEYLKNSNHYSKIPIQQMLQLSIVETLF